MIKYWIKILQQNDTSLLKKSYFMLKEDSDTNNSYNGFDYIWRHQAEIEIPFQLIRQRIIDTYIQSWYSDINNSSRLQAYSSFKFEFELEKYLTMNIQQKYKTSLTRFRTSSHNLSFETGRYDNTAREQRLYQSCNMKKVEDEYHFLLVCPNYRALRQKFFKPYFCHWSSLKKFETLTSLKNITSQNSLAKFIYFANKIRIV